MRPVHQLLDVDGLLGGYPHLLVDAEIIVRVDDNAVEPVDDAELPNAASYSDVWAIDFGHNFGDRIFRQAIEIGRIVRLLDYFHSKFPRLLLSHPLSHLRRRHVESLSLSGICCKSQLALLHPYKDGYRVPVESDSFRVRNICKARHREDNSQFRIGT